MSPPPRTRPARGCCHPARAGAPAVRWAARSRNGGTGAGAGDDAEGSEGGVGGAVAVGARVLEEARRWRGRSKRRSRAAGVGVTCTGFSTLALGRAPSRQGVEGKGLYGGASSHKPLLVALREREQRPLPLLSPAAALEDAVEPALAVRLARIERAARALVEQGCSAAALMAFLWESQDREHNTLGRRKRSGRAGAGAGRGCALVGVGERWQLLNW
ncbi:hypothetical protein HYH02_009794 [Chlamydomonas schloesseri]|uniref:Uncharacterized protein n=1 Tax=Chlamydomonas schloesseri TaxID=2026947 RepID=A0A835W652_9CHLO|nr:hypothetical protein HYH02_009794 [Chlamydomonas schloesseri]|eukprot:KAG2442002.1 hypothetical protein HYH02_009794 [Chlamydomonas schloesseri]